jgi:MYXO-CTERM domain-containing protein
LNPFGAAFVANGGEWNEVFAAQDIDGDGFSNGEELGDPAGAWRPSDPPLDCGCATNPAAGSTTPGDRDDDGDGDCCLGHDVNGDGDCLDVGERDGSFDCDDADPGVSSVAAEICTNAIDNDCDGLLPADDPDCATAFTDVDGDGYCEAGIDADGDADCEGAEVSATGDCDDTAAAVHPGADEDCDDGRDTDCDGLADAEEPECADASSPAPDGGADAGRLSMSDASTSDAGPPDPAPEAGCACRAGGRAPTAPSSAVVLLVLAALLVRRWSPRARRRA